MVLQSNFLSNCYIPNFTYTVSFFNLKKKKKILPFPEYLRNFQNWSSCWPYSHNNWRSFGSYFGLKKLHKLSFWTPEAQSSKIWKKVQFGEAKINVELSTIFLLFRSLCGTTLKAPLKRHTTYVFKLNFCLLGWVSTHEILDMLLVGLLCIILLAVRCWGQDCN